jgi:6-phosphogluconolactonase
MSNIKTFPTPRALQSALAKHISEIANWNIEQHGRFCLAITGGGSFIPIYRYLRNVETNWQAWHVYWTDERCVPDCDPERNSWQANEAWLGHVPIPTSQIFSIPAELGPNAAAEAYGQRLINEPAFDLVLLSLGEDGHVASVFPGKHFSKAAVVLPILDSPKPPTMRVTLSLSRLANSSRLILLALGSSKQVALMGCRNGELMPATELEALSSLEIWADSAAMSSI